MLLNCPACGAPLDYDGTSSVIRCKFCGNRSLVQNTEANHTSNMGDTFDEIRQMTSSGSLQEALERVHTLYGLDMEDANDALDAIKEGRFATKFVSSTHSPAELTQTLQQIQTLLAEGNKVEAVKLYRETFDTSMDRALKAIDMIKNGQGLQIESSYETYSPQTDTPQPPPYFQPKPNAKGCRALPVVIIIAFLAVAGIILAIRGGWFLPHYYAQEPEILIPSGQGAAPQIAGLFYDSNKETHFIGLLNTGTKRLAWQADPLKGDGLVREMVNGSDLIYVAYEDNLLAYTKSDGKLAWQTVMSDALNYSGHDLLVTSGRVITRNADQSIQAYNAETGSLAWSKRLTGYSDIMLLLDKSLLVEDYADNNYNYGLYFFDPVTGNQQDLVTPTCTMNESSSSLDTDTEIFFDEADNALYLIFYEGCVQKIDLANRTVTWNSNHSTYFRSSSYGYEYIFSDSSLYFGNAGDLFAVNKSNGVMSLLSQNEDYNLYPLMIDGDMLILRADRTRGTNRSELWGVDISDGAQSWQITMQDAEPIDPPNEMSGFIDKTDFGWTLIKTSTGLMRMTFKGEPNQLVLETINAADGSVQSSKTINIKGASGDFYDIPKVLGWQGNTAYLDIDSGFYRLDVSTGELVNIY